MKRILALFAPVAICFVFLAFQASALINPNFTPLNLVEQSGCILLVTLGKETAGKLPLRVVRAVKGKAPTEKLVVDLNAAPVKEHADRVRALAKKLGNGQALLFFGKFQEEGEEDGDGGGGGGEKIPNVLLHISGKWVGTYARPGGVLALDAVNAHLLGTWDGGTDMLLRAVEYSLHDPDPEFPVRSGAMWTEWKKIAVLGGKTCTLSAVDLTGNGRPALFAGTPAGDRLFLYDPKTKKWTDATAARQLSGRSRRAAWGDFNGDGRLDLASLSAGAGGEKGATLTLYLQGADGKFRAVKAETTGPLAGVSSLTPVEVGAGRKAGLSVGTAAGPVLLKPGAKEGTFKTEALAAPAELKQKAGTLGACLVADFDGDGFCDVLAPGSAAGLFYKGTGHGSFAAGVSCAVPAGAPPCGAFSGDFDADGLLDIMTVGKDGCFLWHNRGQGNFEETFALTGESSHIAQPGAFGGTACDVNNDGRQDFLLLYPPGKKGDDTRRPLIFFNRGFRSFGHAHMLDLQERTLLPRMLQGQRAGLFADFDGDGRQELALVSAGGELWVLRLAAATKDFEKLDEDTLSVRVMLPPNAPTAGPVTVSAMLEQRSLGAWNVFAGGPGAFFGVEEAGEVTLKWRFPGGKKQTKKLVVEDAPVRFVLTGGR